MGLLFSSFWTYNRCNESSYILMCITFSRKGWFEQALSWVWHNKFMSYSNTPFYSRFQHSDNGIQKVCDFELKGHSIVISKHHWQHNHKIVRQRNLEGFSLWSDVEKGPIKKIIIEKITMYLMFHCLKTKRQRLCRHINSLPPYKRTMLEG